MIAVGGGSATRKSDVKSPILTWKVPGWHQNSMVHVKTIGLITKNMKIRDFMQKSQGFDVWNYCEHPTLCQRTLIYILWFLSFFHISRGGAKGVSLHVKVLTYFCLYLWIFFRKLSPTSPSTSPWLGRRSASGSVFWHQNSVVDIKIPWLTTIVVKS